MFTRNAGPLLALVAFLLGGLAGCGTRPDPVKYGEIITEVPADLNQPFPLPELDKPLPEDSRSGESLPATPGSQPPGSSK